MGSTSPTPSTDVSSERARYYRANRWTGPAGTGSAAALWIALVSGTETPPRHLAFWSLFVAGAVVLQIASHAIPALERRVADDGLPYAGHVAHATIGVAFGITLWLDIEATRNSEFRWITLACLFAMSAGVVAGFSGVNRFGHLVAIPMWIGAASALFATDQLLAGVAGAIFAVITVRDMDVNGQRWIELFELRIQSEEAAVDSLWAATHDPLTGLVNRQGFIDLVEHRSAAGGQLSVLFVDLDHFKAVNDNYGHAAGDEVLLRCAERLVESFRSSDVVCRLGGDEFCILIEDTEPRIVESLAERVIHQVEQPIQGTWGGEPVLLSASIGISTTEGEPASAKQLLAEADTALYEAKHTGRRRVVRFDQQLQAELRARSGLESQLRQAIRSRALTADAQPIFDIETGDIAAVEFLSRWRLPDGSSVSPGVFIPLAESIGLIGDVTEAMLAVAADEIRRWKDLPGLSTASVSVNVSPIEFRRGTVVCRVERALETHDLPSERLILEITESHQLDTDDDTMQQITDLRSLGVRLVIDDFGTGYSSLQQVLSLAFDGVKLDRSLIARLGEDDTQFSLVRGVHELTSVVGSHVVAEGVETHEQLQLLKRIGVPFGQGYHLCPPVPLRELTETAASVSRALSGGTPARALRAATSGASSIG